LLIEHQRDGHSNRERVIEHNRNRKPDLQSCCFLSQRPHHEEPDDGLTAAGVELDNDVALSAPGVLLLKNLVLRASQQVHSVGLHGRPVEDVTETPKSAQPPEHLEYTEVDNHTSFLTVPGAVLAAGRLRGGSVPVVIPRRSPHVVKQSYRGSPGLSDMGV
jgi:hypothetical protein